MKITGFLYPEILLSGIILLILFWVFLYFKKPQKNFWNISLVREVYWFQSLWMYTYMIFLTLMSVCFLLLLASPQQSQSQETVKRNGIDIEIVFDVSYSMIATDIVPSRIEVAKRVFIDFVSQLENDRVWLILFAGKPFQSVPLSYDYDFLQSFIAWMDVDTIDQSRSRLQWTAIGDGLVLASDILEDETEREKVIILITDGEANRWVEPATALKLLKEKWIKTYTIWVGKDWENTITIPTLFWPQKTLISGLDEEILKKITDETGWKYFRADSPEAFANIVKTISELEKKPLETEVYIYQRERIIEIFLLWMFLYFSIFGIFFIKKIRF